MTHFGYFYSLWIDLSRKRNKCDNSYSVRSFLACMSKHTPIPYCKAMLEPVPQNVIVKVDFVWMRKRISGGVGKWDFCLLPLCRSLFAQGQGRAPACGGQQCSWRAGLTSERVKQILDRILLESLTTMLIITSCFGLFMELCMLQDDWGQNQLIKHSYVIYIKDCVCEDSVRP